MREDFEELMAHRDGELADRSSTKPAEREFDDPESQELLARLAEADAAFAVAADELLNRPVPERLLSAIREPQAEPHSADVVPIFRRRGVVGLAIAASLAAVVATGIQFLEPPVGPVVAPGAGEYATLLQEALETAPSGDLRSSRDGATSVMPVISFRTEAAASYCREFMAVREGVEVSGLACRVASGNWEVLAERRLPSSPSGDDYRVAEGDGADAALLPVPANASELTYAEEQELIRVDWEGSGI